MSYSGGVSSRNATIGQRAYQYEALGRSSKTGANGAPALLTRDADRDAQASLQHVVLTFDPVAGRKLYVNGVFTGDVDPSAGGSLADWDDTFALVLGNETSNNRQWSGLIRLAAVHNRALTATQVKQNFDVGVGERYFLLFNVSTLTGVPQSYIMFEGSQYDSYSYLFDKPTFISLDAAATIPTLALKGMRIGVNGAESHVGQAYATLDTSISASNYQAATGQRLANVGTIIALEKGPSADMFFLSFEQIGSNTHAHTEPAGVTSVAASPASRESRRRRRACGRRTCRSSSSSPRCRASRRSSLRTRRASRSWPSSTARPWSTILRRARTSTAP
jgi:hypothetical protein